MKNIYENNFFFLKFVFIIENIFRVGTLCLYAYLSPKCIVVTVTNFIAAGFVNILYSICIYFEIKMIYLLKLIISSIIKVHQNLKTITVI